MPTVWQANPFLYGRFYRRKTVALDIKGGYIHIAYPNKKIYQFEGARPEKGLKFFQKFQNQKF